MWRTGLTLAALAAGLLGLGRLTPGPPNLRVPAQGESQPIQAVSGAASAVGHEYRQDDFPAIAVSPDGSVWVAWLSFDGQRDDIGLRQFRGGRWGNLQWVPATSGDSWAPQLGIDSRNQVWVVWAEQREGNWDVFARPYDPATHQWGSLQRLSDHALPDTNPCLASDGKGQLVVAWQGFRGRFSQIFVSRLVEGRWIPALQLTNAPANHWNPAVAVGADGTTWVAYDSYRSGSYDVFVQCLRGGAPEGPPIAVATTPLFEARPSVAVDTVGRLWVAWESGPPHWGKDQGYVTRQRYVDRPEGSGAPLAGQREPQIACWRNGRWEAPVQPLREAFPQRAVYRPQVISDGQGSVWVIAKPRIDVKVADGARGYWEYWITRYEGERWTAAEPLPSSKGRLSSKASAATDSQGDLWVAWETDNRREGFYHRPIRQQVYAMRLAKPARTEQLRLKPLELHAQAPPPAHPNEDEDVARLRSYVAEVRGRKLRIVRGDFHRHTELSWDGGGRNDGSLEDFYRYMLDAANMDFGASTDHQGGAWPYWWWYSQKMADMYHVPGVFVPFFGYERSVIFPHGHRNVFFVNRAEARVTPFHLRTGVKNFLLPLGPQGDEPGVGTGDVVENDTKLLYEALRGKDAVVIPHTSATRMGTDWRDNDPHLEPVVEIFQGCRTNYERVDAPLAAHPDRDAAHIKRAGYFPQGMVSNAWAKGYKLGIIASSDHGSTHLSYAMVYTDDFSRKGILAAIRQRHTYGATDNILLDVRMGQYFMGDEFRLERPEPLRVKITGTREIARVVVIKDNGVVYSTEPRTRQVEFTFRDTGEVQGRHFYYVRVEQVDGMLAWSSPFFVNYSK